MKLCAGNVKSGKRASLSNRQYKNLPAGLSAATPRRVGNMNKTVFLLATIRTRDDANVNKKISPGACPLAGTGRRAFYNNSWYMRNKASITHSTSRGLVASVYITVFFILFCRLFAEPAGGL